MKLKLTLDQILEIAGKQSPATQKEEGDGRAVIVRSRDAGVLFGSFAGREGDTIHLKNARQLYKWHAQKGGTLIDVAHFGVDVSKCKFSPASANVTVLSACALIDVENGAAISINSVDGGDWQ